MRIRDAVKYLHEVDEKLKALQLERHTQISAIYQKYETILENAIETKAAIESGLEEYLHSWLKTEQAGRFRGLDSKDIAYAVISESQILVWSRFAETVQVVLNFDDSTEAAPATAVSEAV